MSTSALALGSIENVSDAQCSWTKTFSLLEMSEAEGAGALGDTVRLEKKLLNAVNNKDIDRGRDKQ